MEALSRALARDALRPTLVWMHSVVSHSQQPSPATTTPPFFIIVDPSIRSALGSAALTLRPQSAAKPPGPQRAEDDALRTTLTEAVGAHSLHDLTEDVSDWSASLSNKAPVLFLLRTNQQRVVQAARIMRALTARASRASGAVEFHVAFYPRRSFECEETLREEGVWRLVSNRITSLPLGFVPVEEDVWTLELEDALRETKLEEDNTSLTICARALFDLQKKHGVIPKIRGKGLLSRDVLDLLLRLGKERLERGTQYGSDGLREDEREPDDEAEEEEEEGSEEIPSDEEGASPDGSARGTNDASSMTSSSVHARGSSHPLKGARGGKGNYPASRMVAQPHGPFDPFGSLFAPSTKSLNGSSEEESEDGNFPALETLIVLDRQVDVVTPLCVPLTYESLIDEVGHGGFKGSSIPVESFIALDEPQSSTSASSELVQVSMQADGLFREIRDAGVTSVMGVLNENARALQETHDRVHRTQRVDDLQEIVKQIPELQRRKRELGLHIALAQRLSAHVMDRRFHKQWTAERAAVEGDGRALLEFAQETAARGESLTRVLRFLCLYSITSGGLASAKLDEVRRDLIHAYGFETLFTLDNLERLGWLGPKGLHPQHRLAAQARSVASGVAAVVGVVPEASGAGNAAHGGPAFHNWPRVKRDFRLVVPNVDPRSPQDAAYVFAGMAPLSVRLVELAAAPGWDPSMELMRGLEGPTICEVTQPVQAYPTARSARAASTTSKQEKPVWIVFFVGGVTRVEISALRYLSSKSPFRIVVAATHVTNGRKLLDSLVFGGESSKSVSASSREKTSAAAAPPPAAAESPRNPFA